MENKKKCFVIMPITTPIDMLENYQNDTDHFLHILEHLFIPAIKKADLEPVEPIAKGAELIQAGIIKNLEESDLVLCDTSCLNPNVFFELGIRTALNKPVALIRDDLNEKIPFDTAIINCHKYSAELVPWKIEAEIESLAIHIKSSVENSESVNQLWKYFSMSNKAVIPDKTGSVEERLDFINIQLKGLSKQISESKTASLNDTIFIERARKYVEAAAKMLMEENIEIITWKLLDNQEDIIIYVERFPQKSLGVFLQKKANDSGFKLTLLDRRHTPGRS